MCKEFESRHSSLTKRKKKLNKLKNQQIFLDSFEKKITEQTAAPQVGERSMGEYTEYNLAKQKPL